MLRFLYRGRRRQRLSLRSKLLWTFLVPLTLVLMLVGAAATAALHTELVHEVDARLVAALSRSSRAVDSEPAPSAGSPVSDPDDGPGGPDFLGARGQGAGTLGARVVEGQTAQAALITERGQEADLSAAQRADLASIPGDGRPRTVDLGRSIGDYRVVGTPEADGDVIVTGLPLGGVDAAVVKLVTVEVAAGLVGLLLTGVVGVLVLRRTLRPLSRVAVTAGRITDVPLARGEVVLPQRVPEADTATGDEVGRVGAALNRLLDHVETSLAARQASEMQIRQFVADASHELRTPLASIRGYAELFRRQRQDGLTPAAEDVTHTLSRIETEARRMSLLVDDLLLLARLDGGRDLELGEVDLATLVADAVSDARVAGPGHIWLADLPAEALFVTGDAARLHQVVANLFANVRTHTPEGTTAQARLRCEQGAAVLQVIDDGPGIPPKLLPHVFERFARGDASRSRAAGSTGLGLAIVESVVHAHEGTVTVESRPGRTAFTVRMPSAPAAAAAPGERRRAVVASPTGP